MAIVVPSSPNEDLEIAETSLCFQTIIIIGGLIVLSVSCVLRDQLAGTLILDDCDASKLLKTRISASIIGFVAFIYFFLLAFQTLQETDTDTPADCLSARINFMAAFLVLTASALRLYDLTAISHKTLTEPEELEAEELPLA